MPRTEESNQRIREEQKRKIIKAATRIFAHKGLAATKMSEIATEAEVGYGLLYHYFPSKELLFQAAVERTTHAGFERLIQRIQELPLSPWERIDQLTQIILEGLQREPEGYLISQQAVNSEVVPQEIKDMALQSVLKIIDMFQSLLIEGQKAGQVREGDPGELAALYFACLGGVAMSFTSYHIPLTYFPHPETLLHFLRA